MTECPDCAYAEMSRIQWIMWIAVRRLVDARRPAFAVAASAMFRITAALMGYTEPSWYEKHRQAWERTGDAVELGRMLRHVGGHE